MFKLSNVNLVVNGIDAPDRSLKSLLTKKRSQTPPISLLSNINIEINKGDKIGIMGINGSGKTTLLRVISGILSPTSGTITRNISNQPIFGRGSFFDDLLTGKENVIKTLTYFNTRINANSNYIKKVFDFAELEDYENLQLRHYSSGMRARLTFACSIISSPDILLIDETFATGDGHFAKKSSDYLKSKALASPATVIVSHSLSVLESICNRGIVIDKGKILIDDKIDIAIEFYNQKLWQ